VVSSTDGQHPKGGVTLDPDGNFYGKTIQGARCAGARPHRRPHLRVPCGATLYDYFPVPVSGTFCGLLGAESVRVRLAVRVLIP
jgi:hypothetical protein